MEQEKSPGMPESMFIACFRPSRYKELLTRGKGRHIAYVCVIVLLLVMMETMIPFAAWDFSVGGLASLFKDRFPAFTMAEGRMSIEQPLDFDIGGAIHVKADSKVNRFEKKDLSEDYPEELLFSASNILVKMGDRIMELPLDQMASEHLDNNSLVEAIPLIRMTIGIYFLSSYLVKAMEYMIAAVFFGLLCRAAIRTPEGKFVDLKGTIILAIYARTLFSILISVNRCMGLPFGETLLLILTTFGTILFIDRAEASILNISPGRKK